MPSIRVATAAEIAPLLDAMRADELDVIAGEGEWLATGGTPPEGVVRLFERDGQWVLDDLWVAPASRRQGRATALIGEAARLHRPLWLISDEADVAFYEARGFVAVDDARFPAVLAAHYRAKNEWPAPDHRHVAMVRG